MAEPAVRRATYEDLVRVPSHLVAELIDGQLITSPRPAPPHALATSSLSGELHGPFDRGRGGPGGWIILYEPELHLNGDALVPDLAGWRRERMPALPQTAAFELAPDWVCEVLSPSTAAIDRTVKIPVYAREGVGHVWLIDPLAQTLEVLRLDAGSYRIVGAWNGDAVVHAEPFEALGIALTELWTV
jgi:Uma2 family endonuclease